MSSDSCRETDSTTSQLEQQVSCKFAHAGCDWIGVRIDKIVHETNSHISLLGEYAHETNNAVDELKKYLITIHEANIVLNKDLIDLVRSVDDIRNRIPAQYQTTISTAASYSHNNPPSYNEAMSNTSVFSSASIPSSSLLPIAEKIDKMEACIQSIQTRVNLVERASHDGTLIWIIDKYAQRFASAKQGINTSFDSEYFYTNKYGFKMRVRLYPNGNGYGRDSHMSLYFQIVRHEYDKLQKWPFRHIVTLSLMDQVNNEEHIVYNFTPDETNSFIQPTSDENNASGFPMFVPHTTLHQLGPYLIDDRIIIKAIVYT